MTKFQISKAAVIMYRPNGEISINQNYNLGKPNTFRFVNSHVVDGSALDNVPAKVCKGLAAVKKRDVVSLLPYIKPCNKDFYENFFADVKLAVAEPDSGSDDSDSDLEY